MMLFNAFLSLLFSTILAADDWRSVRLDNGEVIDCQIIDGSCVVEGDIVLGSIESLFDRNSRNYFSARHVLPGSYNLVWRDGVMYYTISDELLNDHPLAVGAIADAIEHYHTVTPVRLVQRTNETDYVEFVYANQFSSQIGRRGERQEIKMFYQDLAPLWFTVKAIIHEIGHAYGLLHTVQRPDRDEYITVVTENIIPGYVSQFTLSYPPLIVWLYFDYDYDSIMHYSKKAFTVNGNDTLIASNPPGAVFGVGHLLSAKDIAMLTLYHGFGVPIVTVDGMVLRGGNNPGVITVAEYSSADLNLQWLELDGSIVDYSGACLDVVEGSVVDAKCSSSRETQKWQLNGMGVQNVNLSLCLEVVSLVNDSVFPAMVGLEECDGSPAQRFVIGMPTFEKIYSSFALQCLNADSNLVSCDVADRWFYYNGQIINEELLCLKQSFKLAVCNGDSSQQWLVEGGTIEAISGYSDSGTTCMGAVEESGQTYQVELQSCSGSSNEAFDFV